jgi:hypothetical protein
MSDPLLSEAAIVAGLVRMGVPREKAIAEAKVFLGESAVRVRPGSSHGRRTLVYHGQPVPLEEPAQLSAPTIAWPVRILLPWSCLISDNDRKEPYLVKTAEGPRARMRLATTYRAALDKIANLARNKVGDAAPAAMPLAIEVRVWVPNNTAHNDIANFCKLVHDCEHALVRYLGGPCALCSASSARVRIDIARRAAAFPDPLAHVAAEYDVPAGRIARPVPAPARAPRRRDPPREG